MSILSAPYFHDEEAAYEFVEARIWPQGPVCPHCRGFERISKMKGKSTRVGTYKCYQCRKPFTVKIGTIFEASHIPLHKWLQAIFLIASSKKGISSNQLHRTLGITLKSAWFLSHRIREAMRDGTPLPFGGGGSAVEADETFIGRDYEKKPKGSKKGRGYAHKFKVLSLVDRRSGKARSMVVDKLTAKEVMGILETHIFPDSVLMTDEAGHYVHASKLFDAHGWVHHGKGQYGRGSVHTNTIEGFFSIFKRGMKGVYQHASERHLYRYLAEFDFRYSNRTARGIDDQARADKILHSVTGKRLTYQTAH